MRTTTKQELSYPLWYFIRQTASLGHWLPEALICLPTEVHEETLLDLEIKST